MTISSLAQITATLVHLLVTMATTKAQEAASQPNVVRVRYGYFSESRPVLAACARGWLDLQLGAVYYKVACYPQSSGNFVAARLDAAQLDLAHIGSTPWAQAVARGVDAKQVYISHYMGESQGLYVRPSEEALNYSGIVTPYDLRNKTVGVPFGSTTHYQLLFLIDLLEIKGTVRVVNMSPQEIVEAWDADPPQIDAAACWGTTRSHILDPTGKRPAKTLLSSGVISDWGRTTYVVVAATRKFADQHPEFVRHFVGILSRVIDSFIDELGEEDERNTARWEPLVSQYSLIPSMVDALMLREETHQKPSPQALFRQREELGLFEDHGAWEQISCRLMGGGPGVCPFPTEQHWSLYQTAEFLVNEKVLAHLGPMGQMSKSETCDNTNEFCGSDIIDGSYLRQAREECKGCLPVGPYANTVPPVDSSTNGHDLLLRSLEEIDNATRRSYYAEFEVGRHDDDSTCMINGPERLGFGRPVTGEFGDGANGEKGKSYSDDMYCEWQIRGFDCESPSDRCESLVQIDFPRVLLWSGDFLRIYADPEYECTADSDSSYMVAQISAFNETAPSIRVKGCLRVVFQSDSNNERFYGTDDGDGFLLSYNRNHEGCLTKADCEGHTCLNGLCHCEGSAWGADCSSTSHCFGTTRVLLDGESRTVASSGTLALSSILQADLDTLGNYQSVEAFEKYQNDAFCAFEIEVPLGYSFVKVEILYDIEPTYDFVTMLTGVGSEAETVVVLTGTHRKSGEREVYFVPVGENGSATLHFLTDARGRRFGFEAIVRAIDSGTETVAFLMGERPCVVEGQHGYNCEVPHCIHENRLIDAYHEGVEPGPYTLGRVVSQSSELPVPAMPWAPTGGCHWTLTPEGLPRSEKEIVAFRFVFNRPFDLEAAPISAVGDKLVIRQQQGPNKADQELFVERCQEDEVCSLDWQTGVCGDDGGCSVRTTIEVPMLRSEGWAEPLVASLSLITDRNDRNEFHYGLDFDVLLVQECGSEIHCEDVGGSCMDGFCYCNGIACSCSCDVTRVVSTGAEVGVVVGILVPVVVCLLVGFYVYQRHKNKQLVKYKRQLEQFRQSVVGMKTAVADYIPVSTKDIRETAVVLPRIQWCWKETEQFMGDHDEENVFGDSSDCWIKYSNSDEIEKAFQKQKGKGTTAPLPGYVLDFHGMTQTNKKTGFVRAVKRFAEKADPVDVSALIGVEGGDGLPEKLVGEPQMVLVKGDIIQISKQRDDGWAFGSKMYEKNESLARQLLAVAIAVAAQESGKGGASDDIMMDAGWFPLKQTRQPEGDDLAALQSQVGDTGQLAPPENWAAVSDPSVVQLHDLRPGNQEREAVVVSFLSTLVPPKFPMAQVIGVQRIQNLAMWQSYVVKRQTICYREHYDPSAGAGSAEYQKAMQRFERKWLWHGTNVQVMDKITQQGFNRSFCGKHAVRYGRGVYFARDAAYSAHKKFAVPDKNGVQYMLACRVVVGEYCIGKENAVTPDPREDSKTILHDSTVGLLGSDTMSSPSIYVTYHDAQAYPEYLIAFKTSRTGNDDKLGYLSHGTS